MYIYSSLLFKPHGARRDDHVDDREGGPLRRLRAQDPLGGASQTGDSLRVSRHNSGDKLLREGGDNVLPGKR